MRAFDRRGRAISARTCLVIALTYFFLGPLMFYALIERSWGVWALLAFFYVTSLCVAVAMALTYWQRGWSPRGLGFCRPAMAWVLWGLALGSLIQLATGVLGLLVSEPGQEALADFNQDFIAPSTPDLVPLAGSVAVICLLVPVLEETLFRGVFYAYLQERRGLWIAAGGSTALFAFAHGATLSVLQSWSDQLLVLTVFVLVGLMALKLRVRSGSLYPAIALHATYNATALVAPIF